MKRLFSIVCVALCCGFAACESGKDADSVLSGEAAGSNFNSTADADSTNVEPSADAGMTPMEPAADEPMALLTQEGVCCDVSTNAGCTEVRQCVCGDWQQQACCDDWTTFCQITAEEKCGAAPGCEGLSTMPAGSTGTGSEKGACCSAHETPGCADSVTEQCVCALLPDCCGTKWDALCVQLVNEKHCEPGVRTCVCDQWQQATCCNSEWTSFCETVAEQKCGAAPGCG